MGIFLIYLFGFGFLVFLKFVLVFGFVTISYFLFFIKFKCGGMLASRLWKSLLFSIESSWVFSWVFYMSFSIFNIILIHFYWLLSLEWVLLFPALRFAETSYLTFIVIQLIDCHVWRYLGVENLGTDYKTVLYVYVCMCICLCVYVIICNHFICRNFR